jgi:hypothetical protein
VIVKLTRTEVRIASLVGVERNIGAIDRGYKPRYGQSAAAVWSNHFAGALGEIAVAKLLDLYPKLEGDPGYQGDLSSDIEIRTTGTGHLILHPGDPDDRPFVMVSGAAPRLSVNGWLLGAEGKLPCYWRDNGNGRPPAYFVPASVLHPMETLPR